MPFYLDRVDRHVDNHSWTGLDVGGANGTDVWRKNFLGCFITDPSALHLVDRIGIDTVAWECDYPHSDSTWPRSPELLLAEMNEARLDDAKIHKITSENACRFYRFDPFKHRAREQCTVAALRSLAADVDTSVTPKALWRERYLARH